MEDLLVTVLMPVYNGEKFLREAIESILNQTLTAFEFIIIDDGSIDDSVSIINSYQDRRIKLVQNTANIGISATLNEGIALASSDLIVRMDADDISYPNRLQAQYDFLKSHPDCALLSSWARVLSEDKVEIKTEKYNPRFYYYNMTFSCWIYHPTVMYRKSAVTDVGGYSVPYAEDYDLFWKMIRKYRFDVLDTVLLDYRVTTQSLHQVTKKNEYENAMHTQTLRNIRFYAGESLRLSYEELRCLQYDFEPILRLKSTFLLLKVFRKLRVITNEIIKHPNPNLDEAAVREAWYFKRKFIISGLSPRLSGFKRFVVKTLLRLID